MRWQSTSTDQNEENHCNNIELVDEYCHSRGQTDRQTQTDGHRKTDRQTDGLPVMVLALYRQTNSAEFFEAPPQHLEISLRCVTCIASVAAWREGYTCSSLPVRGWYCSTHRNRFRDWFCVCVSSRLSSTCTCTPLRPLPEDEEEVTSDGRELEK